MKSPLRITVENPDTPCEFNVKCTSIGCSQTSLFAIRISLWDLEQISYMCQGHKDELKRASQSKGVAA